MFLEAIAISEVLRAPETLGGRESSRFADVWARIGRAFPYRKNDNATYHGDFYTTQDAQSHRADEGIGICKVLLEGVDGEQSQIWFLFCITEQVDVNKLPDLKIV